MKPTCREILASGTPLLDVRAPVEFARGAFPSAVNLPLLEDSERETVGLTYRRKGREAAIALGHSLVSGDVKEQRVRSWLDFLDQNEDALVCCARGGLRSQTAARWLAEAGRPTPRVEGGVKALRNEALSVIERAASERRWQLLGGKTGSGKTQLLREFSNSLDFEAAAHHRGSSFGGFSTPQPSQICFENQVAVELLGLGRGTVLVEHEGRNIGKLAIPEVLVQRMRRSPIVVVEVSLAERVANIVREYVDDSLSAGETAADLCSRYQAALLRLRKRLGDQRWRECSELVDRGFAHGDSACHTKWVERLLSWYYDPMYEYQLSKRQEWIEFSGGVEAVREHLSRYDERR